MLFGRGPPGQEKQIFREGHLPMKKRMLTGLAALGLAASFAAMAHAGTVMKDGPTPYEVVGGVSVPKPLTDKPGDPANGRKVVANRKKGNCLACHKIKQMQDFLFHGEIGPELSDIAENMPADEMRLRLTNPKVVNPDTIMPAFYKDKGLFRVKKKFRGKPILTAQEIEDVIAFLRTLK